MLWSGEWVWRHGPVVVNPHWPRARRSPARGGVLASSEVEFRPRARPALDRGGVSPEGASSPRAKRSFGVAAPGPSSEAEFRLRGAGAGCLLGRWRLSGRGRVRHNLPLLGSFMCLLFREKLGFPPLIRGPLWLSPTVAPEPLRRYPLGTRRGRRLLIGLSSLLVVVPFHGGALVDPRV
jgi:hypothetical protein